MKPTIEEKQVFSEQIMKLVSDTGLEYIEAIVEYCEQTGLDVETAAILITPALKSKIADEASSINLIERFSKLPI